MARLSGANDIGTDSKIAEAQNESQWLKESPQAASQWSLRIVKSC